MIYSALQWKLDADEVSLVGWVLVILAWRDKGGLPFLDLSSTVAMHFRRSLAN
jgi:hypothetical protein